MCKPKPAANAATLYGEHGTSDVASSFLELTDKKDCSVSNSKDLILVSCSKQPFAVLQQAWKGSLLTAAKIAA